MAAASTGRMKGRKLPPRTEAHKRKISAFRSGQSLPPLTAEHKAKISKSLKGKAIAKETLWKQRASSQMKPNKLESAVATYLHENFPGEWQYNVGDFKIAGLYPDFININGRKAVIEVFGDYWHRNDKPRQKVAIYARVGFACVVIWESEFKSRPERLKELLEEYVWSPKINSSTSLPGSSNA